MKVTGGICPSVFFINYAYICTGIRWNLNEMCLFSPLGYYHMTYIGKQNSWRGLLTPWTMTHDHFLKKKGSANKLTNKKLKKSMESSSLFFWVSCVSLGILCMLLKSVLTILSLHVPLNCIWIPVYPVRGVGRLPPGPTLTLLHTGFERKGTPFIYFLLANGTPFTYLV